MIAHPEIGIKINGHVTTYTHRAPELFGSPPFTYNAKTDIWALGIAFLHILNNGRVFSIFDDETTLLDSIKRYIGKRSQLIKILRKLTPNQSLIELISDILYINPNLRLNIDDIVNHKVFMELDGLSTPLGRIKVPGVIHNVNITDILDIKDSTVECIELATSLYNRSELIEMNYRDIVCWHIASSAYSYFHCPPTKYVTKEQFIKEVIRITKALNFELFIFKLCRKNNISTDGST